MGVFTNKVLTMKALKVLFLVACVGASPLTYYKGSRPRTYQRSYSGYIQQPYRYSYNQPFTAFRSTNYQQPQQQQYNQYQSQPNRYQYQQQTPRFTPTQSFSSPAVRTAPLSSNFGRN